MSPRLRLAALLIAACTALPASLLVETDARASVSIAVQWDGLLKESTAAVVVTPSQARAVWENGRIYTYTRVHVDRAIAGGVAAGGDVWVRTMGGVVGTIGQIVEGEPLLAIGQSSLVFLHSGPIGAFEVTARGQGLFPVVVEGPNAAPRVVRSRTVGALIASRATATSSAAQLAADVLDGRTVDEASQQVAAAWSRTHPAP